MGSKPCFDDVGIGFPRDCAPTSAVGGQWQSAIRGGQSDWAWFIVDVPSKGKPVANGNQQGMKFTKLQTTKITIPWSLLLNPTY